MNNQETMVRAERSTVRSIRGSSLTPVSLHIIKKNTLPEVVVVENPPSSMASIEENIQRCAGCGALVLLLVDINSGFPGWQSM